MNRRTKTQSPALFTQRAIDVIKRIPRGRVATYGQIAAYAGEPRAARQVVWILHSYSDKHRLPWHRVVNGKGRISLPRHQGYGDQKRRLEKEGVKFGNGDTIDFKRYLWSSPRAK